MEPFDLPHMLINILDKIRSALVDLAKAIPHEVWAIGASTRIIDISNNSIQDYLQRFGNLTKIQKLLLNANELADEFISWEGLISFTKASNTPINEPQLFNGASLCSGFIEFSEAT